ncbi:jerky protein homolog-like [Zophobas morio]|uniref:jerky protein homolog-like n=1 Tax=Zophobas morio TaxID=2755281 RepID=UPI003082B921
MPCANAAGTHKLKLLVIGKAKNPRAFKNINRLPVVYKAQRKGWVTRELFHEWFHEEFIPAVKNKMKELNLPQKALLCIDNAPGHPDADELSSEDKSFQTLFLPPNCNALIQPMDQHVIKNVKLYYRKSLLLNVISKENEDITTILKKFDLLAAVFSLRGAWSKITSNLLQKSWKNLWPTLPATLEEEDLKPLSYLQKKYSEEKREINLIEDLCRKIIPDITSNEVQNWVNPTDEDILFTEDEIVSSVNEDRIDDTGDSDDGNEQEPVNENASHTETIKSFNVCLNWCMKNNIPEHKYLMLKDLQDQAIRL